MAPGVTLRFVDFTLQYIGDKAREKRQVPKNTEAGSFRAGLGP